MYIHLDNNNKIDDICSRLDCGHKRIESFSNEDYIKTNECDLRINDTWAFESNTSLKDSPLRDIIPEKSEIQKKLEELELRIETLESQLQSTKKL